MTRKKLARSPPLPSKLIAHCDERVGDMHFCVAKLLSVQSLRNAGEIIFRPSVERSQLLLYVCPRMTSQPTPLHGPTGR